MGSEVEDPQRNIPLALIAGTILVGGIYLLFSAVCFYALPFASVASSSHVASDVVASFAGRGAARWITIAMVIAALGTLNSSLLSGARVPYAMARDGLFFRVTGIVHPKFRTPGGALIFQGTLASLMALDRDVRRADFTFCVRRLDFLCAVGRGDVPAAAHFSRTCPGPIARGVTRWCRRCLWPERWRLR